ncbi:rhomboid family intramembrane serine protease [[Pseudomonas] boreopolis]|uniref:rhomboid family intramembrane serine protease n=1 Tax=Xanthomonas boreopolis TaxID=86183 RepID=UPI003D9FE74E
MFILPLHKPLDRETFPWITMLLVLANVLVFFGLQAGDDAAFARARAYYLESGLGRYELPAYERYLQQAGRGDALAELRRQPEPLRFAYVATGTVNDPAFQRALAAGGLFEDAGQESAWEPLRRRYDALLGEVFTLRHNLRSSEWSPWRMVAAAFLHGGVMHLVGNMLFLVALGLLLEGAIGPLRLLAVYVLGAFGASAASLLWRWGQPGGGLGASGAIAALMGAFCVVWGRRPVRFFYWFGMVFDYARAPAIVLLPLWLGWELYNLLFGGEKGIGFDAHAGGLVTGALLGGVLVLARQTRPDFMHDAGEAGTGDDRWERAQRHLGRMENLEAERLLADLAAEQPQRFDVALARCRVARNAGQRSALRDRALELLALTATDAEQARAQRAILQELPPGALPARQLLSLARRWSELGLLAEAEALLQSAGQADASREWVAQAWLSLAMRHAEQNAPEGQRRILGLVAERYADQPQAAKARFLLDNP